MSNIKPCITIITIIDHGMSSYFSVETHWLHSVRLGSYRNSVLIVLYKCDSSIIVRHMMFAECGGNRGVP